MAVPNPPPKSLVVNLTPSDIQDLSLRKANNPQFKHLLQIHITDACNIPPQAQCKRYCYQHAGRNSAQYMHFETFREVLITYQPWQIALGGGEPLLHPQFCQFVKFSKEEIAVKHVNFTTNAVMFPPSLHKILPQISGVSISADSLRYPKMFEGKVPPIVIKNIRAYANTQVPLALNFVVSERNIADLPRLPILAQKWGFTGIYLLSFKSPRSPFMRDRQAFLGPFWTAYDEARELGLQMGMDCCMYAYLTLNPECGASQRFLDVHLSGKISGCSYLRFLEKDTCNLKKNLILVEKTHDFEG